MTKFLRWMVKSAASGKLAGTATAATAAACGFMENGNAIAPLNAVSHIIWGEDAVRARAFSVKYTLVGLFLNDAATASWAALHRQWFGAAVERRDAPASLAGGAAVACLAYLMDYHVVPKRLTPGFEKHLSRRSLFLIYVVLALTLGLSGLLTEKASGD